MVWEGGYNPTTKSGTNEIFLYNGTTTTQLTNNDYHDSNPQINDEDHVVWSSMIGPANYHVFLYKGSSTIKISNKGLYMILMIHRTLIRIPHLHRK